MNKILYSVFFCIITLLSYSQKNYNYVEAPTEEIKDIYYNDVIEDPYQWMENLDDPRLDSWIDDQKSFAKKLYNRSHLLQLQKQIATVVLGIKRNKTANYKTVYYENKSKYIFDTKWINYGKSPNLIYKLRDESKFNTLIKPRHILNDRRERLDYSNIIVNEELALL
ncbi:hypothetical protein [Ekhidna sp.]|uniref:hypothetical protein n=1 Tax=Ekhidna sp. TaxID=2608089 RepID=UPI003B50097C